MIEIKGKYNKAIVYTNNIEEEAINQIKVLCDQEFIKEASIRIMPDVHSGVGCVIGTTMTITDKVVPNLVGVDIGCGMETIRIKEKRSQIDLEKLDNIIKEFIPSGKNVRDISHYYKNKIDLTKLKCFNEISYQRALDSIGTLGGGNHFIEMNEDDENNIYLVVHSGSRYLGTQVASIYQKKGFANFNKLKLEQIINSLKKDNKHNLIQDEIKKYLKNNNISKDLAYVEGIDFADYLFDMALVQEYASLNRKAIVETIVSKMGFTILEEFTTIHNYIDTKNMILRKGAVSALEGEVLLIPINMRDGSLICIGKGNPKWNFSAPHGAGRKKSRKKAKEEISLKDFEESMKGIYTTTVNAQTLDESAFAYKPINDIISHIKDTVDIIKIIKPIYNYKASE